MPMGERERGRGISAARPPSFSVDGKKESGERFALFLFLFLFLILVLRLQNKAGRSPPSLLRSYGGQAKFSSAANNGEDVD